MLALRRLWRHRGRHRHWHGNVLGIGMSQDARELGQDQVTRSVSTVRFRGQLIPLRPRAFASAEISPAVAPLARNSQCGWMREDEDENEGNAVAASEGTTAEEVEGRRRNGVLTVWDGDYHKGKELLARIGAREKWRNCDDGDERRMRMMSAREEFQRTRRTMKEVAKAKEALLVHFGGRGYETVLPRAPQKTISKACEEALGKQNGPCVIPLAKVLGMIGALEWRKKGIEIKLQGIPEALRIYPHYGVFPPTRHEYADLLMKVDIDLDRTGLALDVGTGTGILAAILLSRGVKEVALTDINESAIDCAKANLNVMGFAGRFSTHLGMFPNLELLPKPVDLVVCNPPWIPGTPHSDLDLGIYDEDSKMLRQFLAGVEKVLAPDGRVFLIISDLAEKLELRSPDSIETWIKDGGLQVLQRIECSPIHPKAKEESQSPLQMARASERVSLWVIQRRGA